MCTLLYYPLDDGYILWSNRDDQAHRVASRELYTNESGISYIKDQLSNWTWLAIANHGEISVVLNNRDQKITPKNSRGLLPLGMNIPEMQNNDYAWHQHIHIQAQKWLINHAKWDQINHTKNILSDQEPMVWRANTLYTQEEIMHAFSLLQQEKPIWVDAMYHLLTQLEYDENQENAKKGCITKSSTVVRYNKNEDSTEFHHWESGEKILTKNLL